MAVSQHADDPDWLRQRITVFRRLQAVMAFVWGVSLAGAGLLIVVIYPLLGVPEVVTQVTVGGLAVELLLVLGMALYSGYGHFSLQRRLSEVTIMYDPENTPSAQYRTVFITHALIFLLVFISAMLIPPARVLLLRFSFGIGLWAVLLLIHAVIFAIQDTRAQIDARKRKREDLVTLLHDASERQYFLHSGGADEQADTTQQDSAEFPEAGSDPAQQRRNR